MNLIIRPAAWLLRAILILAWGCAGAATPAQPMAGLGVVAAASGSVRSPMPTLDPPGARRAAGGRSARYDVADPARSAIMQNAGAGRDDANASGGAALAPHCAAIGIADRMPCGPATHARLASPEARPPNARDPPHTA